MGIRDLGIALGVAFGLLLVCATSGAPEVRCDFFKTSGGFLRASGGASGNLRCGQWPSFEAAKQECWTNRECDGMSWGRWGKGTGGCLKKNRDGGFKRSKRFSGFHKTTMGCCSGDHFEPGQCKPRQEALVSLHKPAKQSSTAYGGDAGRAVDGNVNTNFGSRSCTHTKSTKSPWWQVDLGKSFEITRIVITNRGDCCWKRLTGFNLYVGDKQPFTSNPTCVTNGKQGKGEAREWHCPLTGRFVTISLKGSGYLTLCEVQVFASVTDGGSAGPSFTPGGSGSPTSIGGSGGVEVPYPGGGSPLPVTTPTPSSVEIPVAVEPPVHAEPTLSGIPFTEPLAEDEREDIISFGKNARQSSTSYDGVASRGNDGDQNSVWGMNSCTATTNEKTPWWEVDLGQSYQVTKVVITNRGDCCWDRLDSMEISVGDQQPYSLNPSCVTGASQGQGETVAWDCALVGQYVTVSLQTTTILTLCEVQVYGVVTTDPPADFLVSPGKNVRQSSTSYGGVAQRGNDGNINSQWSGGSCTATNSENTPWWEIDLGETYELTKVKVTNRGDVFFSRLSKMKISVGDNQPYTLNSACVTNAQVPEGATMEWNCPLIGRYLTISLDQTNILTLCEVQVYALKKSGESPASASIPASIGSGGGPAAVNETTTEPTQPVSEASPEPEPFAVPSPESEPVAVPSPEPEPVAVSPPVPHPAIGGTREDIVSFGKNVSQSTTAFGGVAQRGNDGNQNSVWGMNSCTHTSFMKNPWWEVDLGRTYKVTKVVVTNRGDCCWDRLKFMEISVGDKQPYTFNPSCVTGGEEGRGEAKSWKCALTGRYVTVSLHATNYLTLCEVQVYALVNTPPPADMLVSPGKNVIQSSTAFGGVAQRGIDGKINSQWTEGSCTHTTLMSHPYWQVDLGKIFQVTRVKITNRGDCCWDRLSKMKISVGNKQPYSLNPACVVNGAQVRGETKDWECQMKGRYVTISLEKTDYLTLCEVQVFALRTQVQPPTPPPPGGVLVETLLSNKKHCRQSSTGYGGVCGRAVDGNRNSVYGAGSCTHTSLMVKPWWEVDLGRSYKLTKVVITNRGDCCWDRLNGMHYGKTRSVRGWSNLRQISKNVELTN